MSEKEFVVRARAGDKDAFCELYKLYKDRLYRYAFYQLGDADDAEDAVADTISSAYEQIKSLRKTEAFSAWIFRILRNNCTRYLKNHIAQREAVNISDVENSISLSQSINNNTSELIQALNQLKPDEKELVLLCVVVGLSSKEIAKLTDLTAGSVRSKLSRSLAKMRSYLE